MPHDEIDFPNTFERNFLKARTVALIIGGLDFKLKITLLGIKKRKQLRVWQKNIHVMALAMPDPKHHRGTAAERPMINYGLF